MIHPTSPIIAHGFTSPQTPAERSTLQSPLIIKPYVSSSTLLQSVSSTSKDFPQQSQQQQEQQQPSLNQQTTTSSKDDIVDFTNSRKLLKTATADSGATSSLTPRKRALARKLSDTMSNRLSNETSPIATDLTSSKFSTIKKEGIEPDLNARTTLFQFKKAKILLFEELSDTVQNDEEIPQGRLIGHGNIEVYQLHQQKVSYLQCGSVVYPILPRLKILKVSFNQFIVPLSNPERYWRIILETNDEGTIKNLESSLKSICHFRNLFFASDSTPNEQPKDESTTKNPKVLVGHHNILDKGSIHNNIKQSISLSSITTSLACLTDESDSNTQVDEEDGSDLGRTIKKEFKPRTKSNASSLDIELNEFSDNDDDTQYYSFYPSAFDPLNKNYNFNNSSIPSPSLLSPTYSKQVDFSVAGSFDSSHTNPSKYTSFNQSNPPSASIFVPKTRTRSSRSTSLYQSETSWMDPEDDPLTSTPRTERYISLNLNPDLKKKGQKSKRILTDPIFNLGTVKPKDTMLRYSSYEFYNILKDDKNVQNDNDTRIKSFIQSFFTG